MRDLTDAIVMIDNDKWEDAGKKYLVKEMLFRPNTTGVTVGLQDENNQIHYRVVPYHQLYKVD